MRRTTLFVCLVLCAVAAASALGATIAVAQVPTDCASCHAKYPSDSFDQYSNTSPVSPLACWSCHGALYHGNAEYFSPYGTFQGPASLDFANPATLGLIHTAHRTTTVASLSQGCQRCHGGTACNKCHVQQAPHGDHTVLSGGGTSYPGATEEYAKGIRNETEPYNYTDTLTCTNASCHGSMNTTFTARPTCLGCHGTDKSGHGDVSAKHESATITPACTTSGCHGSANLVTEHEARSLACATCHDNPDAGRAATLEAAIAAGDTACGACHTNAGDHAALHEADPPATGCTDAGCHVNNFATEHANRTDPGTGQPYDCGVCHSPTARTEAQDAIAAYRGLGAKATCITCHASTGQHHALHEFSALDPSCQGSGCHANYLDSEHAGRGLACATCHDNPSPERAATLEAAIGSHDRSCSACHSGAGEHQTQHEANPRIDDPALPYGSNSCENCHLNNMMDEHARRRSADGTPLTCATCHSSTRPDVTAAIAAGMATPGAGTACTACHTIHGSVIAIHESPTTQPGSTVDGLRCGECHASNLGTVHDAAGLGCSACHDSASPTVMGAIRSGDKQCSACHSPYHNALPGAHTAASAESTACGVCHDTDPEAGVSVTLVHANAPQGKCAVCHDNPARVPDIGAKTAECASCHAGHGDLGVKHTATTSQACVDCHETPDVRALHPTCATCHSGSVAGKTAECVSCHVVKSPPDPSHYAETTHTATPFTAAAQGGTFSAGGKECGTCHSATLKAAHGTTSTSGGSVTCVECHNDTTRNSKALIAGDWPTRQCVACHDYGTPKTHATYSTAHVVSAANGCAGSGANCHNFTDLAQLHDKSQAGGAPKYGSCANAGCHSVKDSRPAALKTPDSCGPGSGGCHADKTTGNHGYVAATHAASGSPTGCFGANCHNQELKPEHDRWMTRYPQYQSSCQLCHTVDQSTGKTKAESVSPWGKSCEACHPQATEAHHDAGVNFVGWTICAGCHPDARPGMVALSGKDWRCWNCHGSPTHNANVHGIDSNTKTYRHATVECYECHRQTKAGQPYYPPYAQVSCFSCHGYDNIPNPVNGGVLLGFITDAESRNPINNAIISISPGGQILHSDADGYYEQLDLADGTYLIQVEKSNYVGQTKTAVVTGGRAQVDFVLVPVANDPPVANAGPDKTVTVGQAVTFDGSASYDPDGSIAGYAWNFGDGGTGSGVTVTHTYVTPGTYAVTLTATDDLGATATDTAIVTVSEANLALGKTATASSSSSSSYGPSKAVDGSTGTYWQSARSGTQWLKVDLASPFSISKVVVAWSGSYYAKVFRVDASADNNSWTTVYSATGSTGGTKTATFSARNARYVRVYCTQASKDKYRISELGVYKQ